MKSNFSLKQLIAIMLVFSSALLIIVYFYVSVVNDQNRVDSIIENSKEEVKRLQMVRAYYTKFVVSDIKKNAPNIDFSYNHENKNETLPFPTTVIHDLTKMYSSRSDIKIALYSEFPFLNRKDRILTSFQKEAIAGVEKSKDGVFYRKDTIDGKEVLRVAIADYMILPACVNCHNSHKLKNWPKNKWKLGDNRGILEIITPL